MELIIVFVILLGVVIFYVINKNKKANPDLLKNRTAIFEEFKINCSADAVYKEILNFGQVSDYKIDYVNNTGHQLILNYVPKMGEQTNGSFFPIWVNEIDDQNCIVCVGAKDKSAISMNFEVKKALGKMLPKLQAALYSVQGNRGTVGRQEPLTKSDWNRERDLSNDEYQIYLVKKYAIEKNDVLGKFITGGKSYDTVVDALSAAHFKDVEIETQRKVKAKIILTAPKQSFILGFASYGVFVDGVEACSPILMDEEKEIECQSGRLSVTAKMNVTTGNMLSRMSNPLELVLQPGECKKVMISWGRTSGKTVVVAVD
jgi:hypothetical protein